MQLFASPLSFARGVACSQPGRATGVNDRELTVTSRACGLSFGIELCSLKNQRYRRLAVPARVELTRRLTTYTDHSVGESIDEYTVGM